MLTIDNKDVNNIVCEKLNPHSLDKINNIKELGSEYFEKYAYTMGKCCSEHGLVINCFQNFIQQHNEKVTQLQEKYKNSNINIETIKQQEVKLLSDINSSADRIKTLNMKLDTKTDFSKEIANIKKDLNNGDRLF